MADSKSWMDKVRENVSGILNPTGATFQTEGSLRTQESETPFEKSKRLRLEREATQDAERKARWAK
jgi:hypothetical protein